MYKQLCAQCYIMCTQFIKCCNQYSGKGFTSTLHTGSHKHHELVNNLPNIGWVCSILPPELEGVNRRPLGTPNRGWVSIRPCICPRIPKLIRTTEENAALVTIEVMELLAKGAIVETNISADNFVSQWKRRMEARDQ